jgi:hypothetical protein
MLDIAQHHLLRELPDQIWRGRLHQQEQAKKAV